MIFAVAGLFYGDEGKGTIVEFLTRRQKSSLVVRYNGGSQAGHNIVLEDGRHHTFSQFGAGTFAGASTLLSRYMIFNPIAFFAEAKNLVRLGVPDPDKRVYIERDAVITTPFHVAANRIKELSRSRRHGSCGMGVGETTAHRLEHPDDAVYVRDLADTNTTLRKLKRIRDYYMTSQIADLVKIQLHRGEIQREWDVILNLEETLDLTIPKYVAVPKICTIVGPEWLHGQIPKGDIIFEGAQGVLLDEKWGFAPYHTWTDITFNNAKELVSGVFAPMHRIGVVRAYMTRHGAGPFVTEDDEMRLPDEHNKTDQWQQAFRTGHFDAVATRYALDVLEMTGGVDEIAMTHLDRIPSTPKLCVEYNQDDRPYLLVPWLNSWSLTDQEVVGEMLFQTKPIYQTCADTTAFIESVENEARVPIGICSYGPTALNKINRESKYGSS